MSLHPLIEEFEFLIGTWVGDGRGHYPTIDSFRYRETLTFASIPGKPFLRYEQKTAGAEGQPMHTECGFLRPLGGGRIEFVLAQPTGQTELLEGTVSAGHEGDPGALTITFDRSQVRNSESAKRVDATTREYIVDADHARLYVEFGMAAVGRPLQQHLVSELVKQ